ncbi:MAG: prolyl oligopeptidase family serine peptidase [Blastocatellia bacterium]|nr:prolyl oligopeptidase family serine peptidase [Blastocatellia bacterium]
MRSKIALVFSLILALFLTLSVSAQTPVLDRELFFGDPEISGAQLSPDGQFIAFIKPYQGTRNIWVKRTAEPFSAARPVTADPKRPVPAYFWSRDGKFILFVQDKGGDENYNVFAVNPAEKPAAGEAVPKARNLTDAKSVRAQIYAVPKSDPDLLWVGLNDRDPAWHDLYKVKISSGERTLVRKNTERILSWTFDLKDQIRLATRANDKGETEVLRVEGAAEAATFKMIYSCTVFESCGPVRFHKDNKRVYFVTNRGADADLIRLTLFDPETGREEAVESDPLNRVDLGGPIFSDVTDELIGTSYDDERPRVYWKDKAFEADYKWLQSKLPGREVNFGSSTTDETLWLISASSDREPGESWLFDRKSKKLTQQYRVFDKLPREHLAEMKSIRYKSSDGLEIPAYLTLPKGVEAKNLPTIIFPHGGPWARDAWGFDGYAQFLANRGYAVLQPNFRSSTGYGKKFLNAGNQQWGEKMQDDLTWGVKHLVAQGIADPKRVGIMGGSYGGYATLAGVAFTPDVYAAGVAIVAPSNLITLLESIPPYWEAGRKIFHERMGDPTTTAGKAQLERQSPLNAANRIKTPLMVVQGANDPRVKKSESDQIVVALRERNFPVEYIVAPDEGHGFARPVNNMAMFAAAEKFLARHLGGRFQEGATPEVSQRLKEITVDVRTVEKPKRVDAAAVGTPKPAVDLTPGTQNYNAKIELGGQSIEMQITVEIKEANGLWEVRETAKGAMGEILDATWLEKGTLTLTKRAIKQGPVTIDLAMKGNKAEGTMTMNGQSKPISAELSGALFADGAGAYAVMGTLPLAEGYSATFRNFDLQKQKIDLKQLKVVGIEKVTVPAGSFEAYKAEIASPSGDGGKTTIWVARDSRKIVRIGAVMPQMNGATLTSELLK